VPGSSLARAAAWFFGRPVPAQLAPAGARTYPAPSSATAAPSSATPWSSEVRAGHRATDRTGHATADDGHTTHLSRRRRRHVPAAAAGAGGRLHRAVVGPRLCRWCALRPRPRHTIDDSHPRVNHGLARWAGFRV